MKQILSKLLIVLSICAMNCTYLSAQNTITILNEKEGKFQSTATKKWKKEKDLPPMTEVTHLCVEGVMGVMDQKSLKILFPNLASLDLDSVTNIVKIGAADLCLDKLEVLYLPKSCKSFECNYSLKNIEMLYGYDDLTIQRYSNRHFPVIPFVQIKSDGDKNIAPETIDWDVSKLKSLSNNLRFKTNLLVSTMTYLTKHRIDLILHYDVDSKDIYLHEWTKSFSIDLLKKVNHIGATPYSSFLKGIDSISLPSNIKSLPEDILNSTCKCN